MLFKKIIHDLMQRGWTQGQIAQHCKSSQSTISSLMRGSTLEPRYSLATSILSLWKSKEPGPETLRKNAK